MLKSDSNRQSLRAWIVIGDSTNWRATYRSSLAKNFLAVARDFSTEEQPSENGSCRICDDLPQATESRFVKTRKEMMRKRELAMVLLLAGVC